MNDMKISKLGSVVNAKNELFRMVNRWRDINSGRIFMAFASLVKPEDVEADSYRVTYTIRVADILSNTSGSMYDEVDKATQTLMEQVVSKRISDDRFVKYHLFDTIEYNHGYITGTISSEILPFFLIAMGGVIDGGYTKIYLSQYMKLKSIYSQKLYTYLKSWAKGVKSGYHQIALADLHELLGTPDSFRKNFKDFRVRVLQPAYDDIMKNTTLRYTWEAIRKGRAVSAIKFTFSGESESVIELSAPQEAPQASETSLPASSATGTSYLTARCFMQRNCYCERKEFPMCDSCRFFDSPSNKAGKSDEGNWSIDVRKPLKI